MCDRKRFFLIAIVLTIVLSLHDFPRISGDNNAGKLILLARNEAEYLTFIPLSTKNGYNPIVLVDNSTRDHFIEKIQELCDGKILDLGCIDIYNFSIRLTTHFWKKCEYIFLANNVEEALYLSLLASKYEAPILWFKEINSFHIILKNIFEELSVKSIFFFKIHKQFFRAYNISKNVLDDLNDALNLYNNNKNFSSIVIVHKNDEYNIIAAAYATVERARLEVVDGLKELEFTLSRHYPKYVIYVASFSYLKGNLSRGNNINLLYSLFIKGYDGKNIGSKIGVISGIDIKTAALFAARNLLYRLNKVKKITLIYMSDSENLAKKISRIAARSNADSSLYNIKEKIDIPISNILKDPGDIIFINLHGAPWAMSPSSTGPPLITPHNIPQLPPSIIVTLSCKTASFEELKSSRESIVLSFLARGAIAYIGAMALEYTSGLELSTAHPELVVFMILNGEELGEIVRVLNNIHIKEKDKGAPEYAAYTVLFGDPRIRLLNPQLGDKYLVNHKDGNVIVEFKSKASLAYGRIIVNTSYEKVKGFDLRETNTNIWWYAEGVERNRALIFFFVTRPFSSVIGDYDAGDIVKMRIMFKRNIETLLIGFIIVIIIVTIILLRKYARK